MVSIDDLTPRPRQRMGKLEPETEDIDKDELLLVQLAENLPEESVLEDVLGSETARSMGYERIDKDHRMTVHRIRPGRIIMFKPDRETGRIYRRQVPAARLLENRKDGWFTSCPECHTDCSPNPNECPARVKAKNYKLATRCPVCNKSFYDPGPLPKKEVNLNEPGMVNFDDYDDNPQSRVKGLRDDHIRAWHPTIARRMGLFALLKEETLAA